MTLEEIRSRFDYHPPMDEATVHMHEHVRRICKDAATALNAILPKGREHSLAMTHLEEVMFWANASIARYKEED
jgi:hypothetical protein